MYEYKDYFDAEKEGLPYSSTQEEIEDWLRLLDMMLEGYLQFKGLGSGQKLFSRGLVITESEMESYFSIPPRMRERDICDPALAAAAGTAWDYIESRVKATVEIESSRSDRDDEIVLSGSEEDSIPEEPEFPVPDPYRAEDASADEADIPGEEDFEASPGTADFDEFPPEELEEPEGLEGLFEEAAPAELQVLWIDSLRQIFGLDRAGTLAVVMALAGEIDRRYERIFGFLQDDISKGRPTLGLLNALMARITPRDAADELQTDLLDDTLFTSLFVSGDETRGLDTPLVLNPFLKRILLGQPYDETKLPDALSIYREETEIPFFFEESGPGLEHALADPDNRFCYIENEDEDTVLHVLYYFADQLDMPLYVLDLKQLLRLPPKECAACLADLSIRLRLGDGLLAVRYSTETIGEFGEDKELAARRWKLLERISRVYSYSSIALFGGKEEPGELIVKAVPFLKIPAPDVSLRTEMWSYFLEEEDDGIGIADDVVIGDLADCYDISYSMIRNTCSHAKAAAGMQRFDTISREMLLDSLRQLNQVDFSGLANYVRAAYSWEDIKITDDQRALLKVACDRYRLRNRIGQGWGLTKKNAYGNGVSLLLYGPPGTGKTMAAQVVANELGIPLYRVDISQIFSKYIGETEKNLSIIFEAAKGSNVILFFDEADALFSKRTEINNSNDKYANSETAYLLQKIEEYDGMSILATNLYTNFDTAFVRRITYAVRLDSPDEEARYILWTTTLPGTAKLEKDIPFRFLAKKFELSGSNIKAILFSAAYMAGAENSPIGIAHIVRAMEYEFLKLGRFIDREAFGTYAQYLTSAPGEK